MTQFYAVIDTNVVLASLLSKHEDAATVKVMDEVINGRIIPLYHKEMIGEYEDVLHRPKFRIEGEKIRKTIDSIIDNGIEVFPQPTGEILIDIDDLIFYEVAMEKRDDDAYLVTGNLKHYPIKDFIVTPAEMMRIMEQEYPISGPSFYTS